MGCRGREFVVALWEGGTSLNWLFQDRGKALDMPGLAIPMFLPISAKRTSYVSMSRTQIKNRSQYGSQMSALPQ